MYYSRNRRNYSIVESTSYSAVVIEFQTDRRLRNRLNAIQSSDNSLRSYVATEGPFLDLVWYH